MKRRAYPSDVSDEEWALVAPYVTLMTETALSTVLTNSSAWASTSPDTAPNDGGPMSKWWQRRQAAKARKARTRQQWEADEWARIAAARKSLFTKKEIAAWEQKSQGARPPLGRTLLEVCVTLIVIFSYSRR